MYVRCTTSVLWCYNKGNLDLLITALLVYHATSVPHKASLFLLCCSYDRLFNARAYIRHKHDRIHCTSDHAGVYISSSQKQDSVLIIKR